MSAEPRWVGRLLEHDFISSTNRFLPSDHTAAANRSVPLFFRNRLTRWVLLFSPFTRTLIPGWLKWGHILEMKILSLITFTLMLFQSSIKNIKEDFLSFCHMTFCSCYSCLIDLVRLSFYWYSHFCTKSNDTVTALCVQPLSYFTF